MYIAIIVRHQDQGDLVTQKPKCSEGATKGLRVTKLLSSHRSRCLTYLDLYEQESHGNTFERHYKHGKATS